MMIFPSSGLPTTPEILTPYTRFPAVEQRWHSGTSITTKPAACASGFFLPPLLNQFAFVISISGPKNPLPGFSKHGQELSNGE